MNSKQRRIEKRKFRYHIKFSFIVPPFVTDQRALDLQTWFNFAMQGECVATSQFLKFSKEQDAVMFALKFTGE